ncbi:MAG: hypothetical protein ACLP4W_13225 [Mycobacterium sp.]|uniref:hypothetical protein n=1 Tax=Mycobacterium sp. TaxID=1785 RepID=UPI003F9796BE
MNSPTTETSAQSQQPGAVAHAQRDIINPATGAIVGLLSGGPPVRRALRQLLIGYGAATITYLVGLLFGTGLG